MLRVCTILFLLLLTCGKTSAQIGVELDVVFKDSAMQCERLFVFRADPEITLDVLAVFDTLSFSGQRRVSLFYNIPNRQENRIVLVDTSGRYRESNNFTVSPQRTTFVVSIGKQQIAVKNKDYLYPQKNEDERSYFLYLSIFFIVKILITVIFIFKSNLPKRLISIASGASLLSAFIDWFLPLNYLYRFLLMALTEYLLVAWVGRKSISWRQATLLVVVVDAVGFGIIAALYLFYVFW